MWTRSRPRIGVLAAVFGLALLAPLSATASAPEPVTIAMHGVLTGPDSVAGTFTVSGAFSDAGTYVETYRFAGNTIHGVKTLSGSYGTITLVVQAVVRWTSPTRAELFAGQWRLESGTGAYANVHGEGSPGATGSADLAAGTVDVVHEGLASVN